MDDPNNKHHGRDTHAMPPQAICDMYKKYQKMDSASVDADSDIVDFTRGLSENQKGRIVPVDTVPSSLIESATNAFKTYGQTSNSRILDFKTTPAACTIYEHKDFPGLRLLPSLLPPECQILMLDSLLHRDLSNPLHTTNISQDYVIPYPPPTIADSTHPSSFFTYPQSINNKTQTFHPLNPLSSHKPLNTAQFLQKKLRWLTLGSQYDWTTRSYPSSSPTPFPPDIAALVTTLFKHSFIPESGVVLLYSPKDYMPVHRDVSEECERGLASFSLGCDGLFIIASENTAGGDETNAPEVHEQSLLVIRVRSGDVVQMGGETRWAWHAMPKVMADTCPDSLQSWPVKEGGGTPREYERWRGYMRGKRLNISCRQVWE